MPYMIGIQLFSWQFRYTDIFWDFQAFPNVAKEDNFLSAIPGNTDLP